MSKVCVVYYFLYQLCLPACLLQGCWSIHPYAHPSTCSSIHLSVYMSICLTSVPFSLCSTRTHLPTTYSTQPHTHNFHHLFSGLTNKEWSSNKQLRTKQLRIKASTLYNRLVALTNLCKNTSNRPHVNCQ